MEPWGDVVFLAPGVDYLIESWTLEDSDTGPDLTIEHGDGFAAVWSHTAEATIRLWRADGTLVWREDGPIPERDAILDDPATERLLITLASGSVQKTDASVPAKTVLTLVEAGLVREGAPNRLVLTEAGSAAAATAQARAKVRSRGDPSDR
jgi:hypothetical protein